MVFDSDPIPLLTDADGVVRVGSTRVALDLVVAAFNEGMAAEGIIEQYPSLQIADVYAVIGYYLNHRSDIDAYLKSRQANAESTQRANEARWSPIGVRDRLLARRR